MEAKVNRKCHVSFFRLDGGDSLDYLSVIYVIFRIGPGVGVGVGAGVGVDQEPGVGAGVGVGTAPPRLRTPAYYQPIPEATESAAFHRKAKRHGLVFLYSCYWCRISRSFKRRDSR